MTIVFYLILSQEIAAQENWIVDKSHSSIQFTVDHLVVSEVTGSFGDFTGSMTMKGDDFSTASFDGEIQVKSITTGNAQRDGHLMAPDFFDAANHPLITFESNSIVKSGDKYAVKGNLTMKGITKEVMMDVDYKGQVKFMGQTKAGLKATASINRFDYGLNWNSVLETGGAVVGKEVEITLNMELVRK